MFYLFFFVSDEIGQTSAYEMCNSVLFPPPITNSLLYNASAKLSPRMHLPFPNTGESKFLIPTFKKSAN